jgi:hypothetical protein
MSVAAPGEEKTRNGNIGPMRAINIDRTRYYGELTGANSKIVDVDQPADFVGLKSHSWYFGDRTFTKGLLDVLFGASESDLHNILT